MGPYYIRFTVANLLNPSTIVGGKLRYFPRRFPPYLDMLPSFAQAAQEHKSTRASSQDFLQTNDERGINLAT